MANQLFLGQPSDYIKNWFISKFSPTPASIWDTYAAKLEDFTNQQSNLPAVGSIVKVPYLIDAQAGTVVDTDYIVMGYNSSIPQYIKYKNDSKLVYVSSVKSGLLAAVSTGDAVFEKTSSGDFSETSNTVQAIGSGTFTYGNNCTFSVPDSITVAGTVYTFAGYNMTVNSRSTVTVIDAVTDIQANAFQFDSERNNRRQNSYYDSYARIWLNGTGDISRLTTIKCGYNNGDSYYGSEISTVPDSFRTVTFNQRMTDTQLVKHVMPVVNRIWTHNQFTTGRTLDSNQCEHIIDKYWLLGIGNVNCSGSNTEQYFKDQYYDTTIFSNIFTQNDVYDNNESRKKSLMNIDGTSALDAQYFPRYWLHSAFVSDSNSVARVFLDGSINIDNAYIHYYNGFAPAFTIC